MEAYQNAALSPEERAKDLLGKMTLQEKVGQLNQRLYGFRIYERQGEEFTLTEEFKEEVERMGGLGVLYGLYRADPWADKDEKTGIVLELSAKAYNIVQKYVIDHSRLGIPMMMSTECPHGHQALGGGLLPVNLAAGATFDPELLSEGYKACGKQLKSGHVDLALMSALDMARDPRWGRSEECYSEDPCLAASMAKAAVTGMQSTGVGSVAKHFCAQGETTGGVNASAARIGERELREIHFPSAKACCEAGVEGIMAAYNEIDGVYCHRNAWLLRDVLRGEMGFDGIVMADGLAVDFLKNTEGDTLHAGVAARKAGVDVSLWDEAFSRLGEAVGFDASRAVGCRQIHSDLVRIASEEDAGKILWDDRPYDADGLITNVPNLPLFAYGTDCCVITLYDPTSRSIGAVHAGWRGTASGIALKAAVSMMSCYGADPYTLRAAISPSIGKCCFETDSDVADAFFALLDPAMDERIEKRGDKYHIDLKAINRLWLLRAGIDPSRIDVHPDCTKCHPERYWSHRAMGDRRGGMAAMICLTEDAL